MFWVILLLFQNFPISAVIFTWETIMTRWIKWKQMSALKTLAIWLFTEELCWPLVASPSLYTETRAPRLPGGAHKILHCTEETSTECRKHYLHQLSGLRNGILKWKVSPSAKWKPSGKVRIRGNPGQVPGIVLTYSRPSKGRLLISLLRTDFIFLNGWKIATTKKEQHLIIHKNYLMFKSLWP